MSDTPTHSVACVGVAVDEQGRVLVIQRRDTDAWEPPGGVLELDEAPNEGAAREVFEETGVQVEIDRLVSVYKNMPNAIVTLVFRCRPTAGEAGPTDEASAAVWLSPEEAMSRMAEAHAVRIRDAIDERGGAVLGAHDGWFLQ